SINTILIVQLVGHLRRAGNQPRGEQRQRTVYQPVHASLPAVDAVHGGKYQWHASQSRHQSSPGVSGKKMRVHDLRLVGTQPTPQAPDQAQVNTATLVEYRYRHAHGANNRLEHTTFSQAQHLVVKTITAIAQHFTQQTLGAVGRQAVDDVHNARLHRRIPPVAGLSAAGTGASLCRRPATSSGTCNSANRWPSTAKNTQM